MSNSKLAKIAWRYVVLGHNIYEWGARHLGLRRSTPPAHRSSSRVDLNHSMNETKLTNAETETAYQHLKGNPYIRTLVRDANALRPDDPEAYLASKIPAYVCNTLLPNVVVTRDERIFTALLVNAFNRVNWRELGELFNAQYGLKNGTGKSQRK
jgi:hypothetical protein